MKTLLVSLGCDKNRVDAEVMLGQMASRGYEFTEDEMEAEVAIVNTCGFIDAAKEESIGEILRFARMKQEGNLKSLIVTGCLAERYKEEIRQEIPEVDEILGATATDHITEAVEDAAEGNYRSYFEDIHKRPLGRQKRILTTGGAYAYLKIAEGCNKGCTYCIIPKLRGHYRSIPMEDLLLEAEDLADRGVKELILVAQETTLYGTDLYKKKALPELLEGLCRIGGIEWIRLLYCYPEEITDSLIAVIKREKKILPYLDIPMQSGSDLILKRMGRRCSRDQMRTLVGKLRREIPEICIRTTLITGFPGETAREQRETLDFVRDMRFDRLGVFTYSAEEGTPAYEMEGHCSETMKKMRRTKIMKLQQEIAFEKNRSLVGQRMTAFIEGFLPEEEVYVARTYRDAPDVDGYLYISGIERELLSGSLVEVEIQAAEGYDLIGNVVA